jgi:hypothetical protein
MIQSISKTLGRGALGALAVILMFGTNAGACNLAGAISPKPADLTNPALRIGANQVGNPDLKAQRGSSPARVEGLWQVTFSSDGAVVDMAYEVFHADGTEALNDITPPAEGNVCFGVWVQIDSTHFKVTHPSWVFDQNGNLAGTALFVANITLGSADSFSGSYTLTYYDTHGSKGPVYPGTMTATSILPNY